MRLLGWDIGGSNTKVCRVEDGQVVTAVSRPFEVKDEPEGLAALLQALAAEAAEGEPIDAHAVTMTAELSRNFLTKREGVGHVLDAVESAFGVKAVRVFTVNGLFVAPADARLDPMRVASANWMATASWVSKTHHDAVLVDVGSTTTDIIPIVGGVVAAEGRTDPERLASGELLYTGAARTPVEATAAELSVDSRRYTLAAEAFATTADVHVWRGDLAADDVTGGTADGRPADRAGAGHRLARALCSDRELMDDAAVTSLADALADAQTNRVASAIGRVAGRHPSIRRAVVAGTGAFIGARAARAAGLEVCDLGEGEGGGVSRCAPAAAVALLLDAAGTIDVVAKVGGSLLAHGEALGAVLELLGRSSHMLVVPGGGPYADDVRAAHARGDLDDDGAHWAAVFAMDQYAGVLIDRIPRAIRVLTLSEARWALVLGYVPVLAPERWMRQADPLPHSWDVTGDSIAAWVAAQARASTLVLVKAPGATGQLTDAHFERALPPEVESHIVAADQLEVLRRSLVGRT